MAARIGPVAGTVLGRIGATAAAISNRAAAVARTVWGSLGVILVVGIILLALLAAVGFGLWKGWEALDEVTADSGRPTCAKLLRAERRAEQKAALRRREAVTRRREAARQARVPARRRARSRRARRPQRNPRSAARRAARRPRPVNDRNESLAGLAQLNYRFAAYRRAMVRHQPFLVPAGMRTRDVTVTVPFSDIIDDDERPLDPRQVRATVTRRGPGRLVTVAICVNPQLPREMRGGTYTGAALVGTGSRVTPITLEATVRDDRWHYVALAALIGMVCGLFVKLFADSASPGLRRNATSPRLLVAIGAGIVTAVYSFLTIYADDPTFVADFGDLWRVTAEVFAGTLAAKAITDLARPSRKAVDTEIQERQKKEEGRARRQAE
jgi:hypothetical protein